jgi:hypothetical protein
LRAADLTTSEIPPAGGNDGQPMESRVIEGFLTEVIQPRTFARIARGIAASE